MSLNYRAECEAFHAECERVAAELVKNGEYPWRAMQKAIEIVSREKKRKAVRDGR